MFEKQRLNTIGGNAKLRDGTSSSIYLYYNRNRDGDTVDDVTEQDFIPLKERYVEPGAVIGVMGETFDFYIYSKDPDAPDKSILTRVSASGGVTDVFFGDIKGAPTDNKNLWDRIAERMFRGQSEFEPQGLIGLVYNETSKKIYAKWQGLSEPGGIDQALPDGSSVQYAKIRKDLRKEAISDDSPAAFVRITPDAAQGTAFIFEGDGFISGQSVENPGELTDITIRKLKVPNEFRGTLDFDTAANIGDFKNILVAGDNIRLTPIDNCKVEISATGGAWGQITGNVIDQPEFGWLYQYPNGVDSYQIVIDLNPNNYNFSQLQISSAGNFSEQNIRVQLKARTSVLDPGLTFLEMRNLLAIEEISSGVAPWIKSMLVVPRGRLSQVIRAGNNITITQDGPYGSDGITISSAGGGGSVAWGQITGLWKSQPELSWLSSYPTDDNDRLELSVSSPNSGFAGYLSFSALELAEIGAGILYMKGMTGAGDAHSFLSGQNLIQSLSSNVEASSPGVVAALVVARGHLTDLIKPGDNISVTKNGEYGENGITISSPLPDWVQMVGDNWALKLTLNRRNVPTAPTVALQIETDGSPTVPEESRGLYMGAVAQDALRHALYLIVANPVKKSTSIIPPALMNDELMSRQDLNTYVPEIVNGTIKELREQIEQVEKKYQKLMEKQKGLYEAAIEQIKDKVKQEILQELRG